MFYIYIFIYYICNIWATALLTVVLNKDHSHRHGNLVLIKALTLSTKCLIHQKEKKRQRDCDPTTAVALFPAYLTLSVECPLWS